MTINTSAQTKPELELCCSFCRKSSEQVNILIAGPGVFICNECVEICNQIQRGNSSISITVQEKLMDSGKLSDWIHTNFDRILGFMTMMSVIKCCLRISDKGNVYLFTKVFLLPLPPTRQHNNLLDRALLSMYFVGRWTDCLLLIHPKSVDGQQGICILTLLRVDRQQTWVYLPNLPAHCWNGVYFPRLPQSCV